MKRILVPMLIIISFSLLYVGFFQLYMKPRHVQAQLEIRRGESLTAISQNAVAVGIAPHPLVFKIGARLFRLDRQIKAGYYQFDGIYTMQEVLQELTTGRDRMVQVTIPEGLHHMETFQLLVSHGLGTMPDYLHWFNHPDLLKPVTPQPRGTLEGWLFPNTYRFPETATAKDVLEHMSGEFASRFRKIAESAPELPKELTPLELITMASLVEKETGAPEERPLIASVFWNRLVKNMRMDCDPTVIYALILEGRWDGNIRKRDLEMDHPYNTYRRRGLPPGPIANPGAEALAAVFHPASTDYLYFVSRNDGTHDFSETYKEHQRKVNEYQVQYWRKRRSR